MNGCPPNSCRGWIYHSFIVDFLGGKNGIFLENQLPTLLQFCWGKFTIVNLVSLSRNNDIYTNGNKRLKKGIIFKRYNIHDGNTVYYGILFNIQKLEDLVFYECLSLVSKINRINIHKTNLWQCEQVSWYGT